MIEKQENGRRTYSDGAETEKSMLELAEKYSEEEISERIAGDAHYLINNTFSPVRRNLLDWYPFREGCSILEVGAGMGSLTSLLCEKAAHVTAVELGEDRAKVIRARCKDKTNLSIYSDDILTWDNGERFDYVVMVGVLEYAAVFSHSETPFDDFLARLKGFMKPGGVLLFAIENQFGLKYWLGASEDHLQRPYAGIEKYTESGTARTFSKAQLTFMCRRQGWETRFYYLLPDYRFPTAVFTDESLPGFQDVRNVRYTYSLNSCLTADERELYRDVIENNVFPFFANSYLVEAAEVLPGEHVIRVSGRSEVRAEQRIITYIDNSGQVWKRAQSREAQRHIERAYEHEQYLRARGVNCIPSELEGDRLKMPFCGEKLADREFCLALEKGDTEKAHAMIDALRSALEKSSDLTDTPNEKLLALGGCQEEQLLAHGFMDMTFYNAFWTEKGLLFFDQEWDFPGLPLRFILYYAVKISYTNVLEKPQISFDSLCAYVGVDKETADRYDTLERKLWEGNFKRGGDLYGADGFCVDCNNVKQYWQLCDERRRFEEECGSLKEECGSLKEECGSLKEECRSLKEACNGLKEKCDSLKEECGSLKEECSRLNGALSILQNSRRWRYATLLSKPVIFLRQLFQKRNI